MTFSKFIKLYKHYKNNYDFKLKNVSYERLENVIAKSEEWIPG